jgi:DNA-binding response OmpR family regulator
VEEEVANILIGDDDVEVRRFLRRFLVAEGYRVAEAKDRFELQAKLATGLFDLLIMDGALEGGGEVEGDLQEMLPGFPVVWLSREGKASSVGSVKDRCVSKPVDVRSVRDVCRTALSTSKKARAGGRAGS